MIQRIQTLYLFAIVVLIGLTLMMPIAEFISQAQHAIYQLKCSGVWQIIPTGNVLHATVWSLSSVVGVIPVLALIAIFQYKDRVKQIRLCVINFVFIILFYVSLFSMYSISSTSPVFVSFKDNLNILYTISFGNLDSNVGPVELASWVLHSKFCPLYSTFKPLI